jgi:hypothetical protein
MLTPAKNTFPGKLLTALCIQAVPAYILCGVLPYLAAWLAKICASIIYINQKSGAVVASITEQKLH